MMDVKLKMYDGVKHFRCKKVKDIFYRNIRGFEVVTGERAERIISETDACGVDPYNEYLIIYLDDGNKSTFRYSYVDLFINHRINEGGLSLKGGDAID